MVRKTTGFSIIIRAILFSSILGVLSLFLCFMFQPLWKEWNNYETIDGFYQEPKNTIETVFLGPSTVVNGISPIELYEDYGFCTYNLGMERQPLLASYYWLKEAYRFHSDTLKVAFLDPSSMREEQPPTIYQKTIGRMRISPIKLEAIAAYYETWNSIVEHSLPLLEYHDRWDEISDRDYEKTGLKPTGITRGYNAAKPTYIDTKGRYQELLIHHSWYDPEEPSAILTEESLEYFDKMVSFCKEKKIQLILVSPVRPTSWNSEFHNAIKALAKKYKMPYYDLNASPTLDQLEFVMGFDHQDNHLNYYGAKKITAWYGDFLNTNHLNHDVSEKKEYLFMKDQLDQYRSFVDQYFKVRDYDNVGEYLQAVASFDHCYVLISIKDESASSLTEKQRNQFADIGLKKLSCIDYRESYIGVIKDGFVENELCDKTLQTDDFPERYLRYKTGDGINIKSGGIYRGNLSSIMINDTEYSQNKRGINIVVYDYKEDKVYDSASFDTHDSAKRVGNAEIGLQNALKEGTPWYEMDEKVKKLYLYNRRFHNQQCEDYWKIYGDDTSLFAYLNMYNKKPGYAIIISVKDDAASSLSDEARLAFSELGLNNLSGLQHRDSYIGILEEGIPCFEQRNHGEKPINYNETAFSITSGGYDSGNISSVMINGNEESMNKRGLNIVVYDKQLQETVSSKCFDTCAQTPSIAQELDVEIEA